jgi:hypothetical protein
MTRLLTIAFLAAGMCLATVGAQQAAGTPLEIRALSGKAELVSGGDVLVEIAGPAGLNADNVTVRLNGRDVTGTFKPAADSGAVVGLLTGLRLGPNAVEASMGDEEVQLTIVNHLATGPLIYSPHQMPFVCETGTARQTRRWRTSTAPIRLRRRPIRATSRQATTQTAFEVVARAPISHWIPMASAPPIF